MCWLRAIKGDVTPAGEKFATMTSPEMKVKIRDSMDKMGISPDAIARAIVFAIEQPAGVDVNEIIVRPTAQT